MRKSCKLKLQSAMQIYFNKRGSNFLKKRYICTILLACNMQRMEMYAYILKAVPRLRLSVDCTARTVLSWRILHIYESYAFYFIFLFICPGTYAWLITLRNLVIYCGIYVYLFIFMMGKVHIWEIKYIENVLLCITPRAKALKNWKYKNKTGRFYVRQ